MITTATLMLFALLMLFVMGVAFLTFLIIDDVKEWKKRKAAKVATQEGATE